MQDCTDSMVRLCEYCDINPGNKKCAGCSKKWYCSKECQRDSWNSHKFYCDAKPKLSTANYLWKACMGDYFPKHEQTRVDFGFQRAFSRGNQSKLLGLYAGLLKFGNISAKTLHLWRKQGILVQEIKNFYEALPMNNRGGYYPWFVMNQWVLDGMTPEEWGEEEAIKDEDMKIAREGWVYAGGSPTFTDSQIAQSVAQWTQGKKDCWRLCGLLLIDDWHYPTPRDDIWIPFGFCTCTVDESNWAELSLARIYQQLLYTCTFNDLLTAYESSQLHTLLENSDLHIQLELLHPLVEGVLRTSPKISLSVWHLKQFIVNNKLEDHPDFIAIPFSVKADYFGNCNNIGDVKQLGVIYKSFFTSSKLPGSSPVELHNACITGDLYKVLSKQVKMDTHKKPIYRSLMKNHYSTSFHCPQPSSCSIHWANGCTLSEDLSNALIQRVLSARFSPSVNEEVYDHIFTSHTESTAPIPPSKAKDPSRLDGAYGPIPEDISNNVEDDSPPPLGGKVDNSPPSSQDGASPKLDSDDYPLPDDFSAASALLDVPNYVWPTLASVVIGSAFILKRVLRL